MGIWVRERALEPAEKVLWKRAANRTQSDLRAVGGRLYLTATQRYFEPSRLDAVSGGQRWSVALASIRHVGTEQRDGNPLSGSLRTRLRLDLAEGGVELFVVNHVDDVAKAISQAAGMSA